MSIRENSKKIIRHFLEKIIEYGDLDTHFPLQYAELAQALNLKDENYCRICCQYLNRMRYVTIKLSKNGEGREILLNASAIDFLEND